VTTEFMSLLVPALAQTLVQFLWQGAAIGISAWLVLRMLRTARPQARYAVACLALLACLWLPLQTLQRASQAATGPMATTATSMHVAADATPAALTTLREVLRSGTAPLDAATPWVVAVWGVGVVAMLLRMLAGFAWLQRARRNARQDVPELWQSRLRALCARMGLGDRIRMSIGDDAEGPFSAGIFRPVVIVPAALLTRMPVELLEALLAHELAHIRRHDYLVNLLQTLVEALLFYHPAVWWLSHRIRIERELIADDIAAKALGEPRRLALALSALDRYAAAHHPHASHALAQAAQGGHLMTRIQQLLRPSRPGIGARVALPAVALIATGIACYAFAQADRPLSRTSPQTSLQTPQPAPVQRTVAPVDSDRGIVHIGQIASVDDGRGDDSHALIKGGTRKFKFSGDLDDIEEIRAAQAALDGDFLWFRRDGKAYVVRDPAVLARVERAWSSTAAIEAQMEAKSREMERHSVKMEAMSQRMSALGEAQAPPNKMQEANARLQRMAMEQGRLAQQQAEMAIGADDATQAAAEEAIERRMEALDVEIERMSAQIEAESEAMTERMAPMEALAEEMETAAEPMEALGAEMETLGALMELKAAEVNREIRAEIERAVREGRAEAAPGRQ
jgi:beta-lactamase regulating signal transducer with metallopeptidase domain